MSLVSIQQVKNFSSKDFFGINTTVGLKSRQSWVRVEFLCVYTRDLLNVVTVLSQSELCSW